MKSTYANLDTFLASIHWRGSSISIINNTHKHWLAPSRSRYLRQLGTSNGLRMQRSVLSTAGLFGYSSPCGRICKRHCTNTGIWVTGIRWISLCMLLKILTVYSSRLLRTFTTKTTTPKVSINKLYMIMDKSLGEVAHNFINLIPQSSTSPLETYTNSS